MRVLVRKYMCALPVKKMDLHCFSDKKFLKDTFLVFFCHFCLTHFKFSSCATIPRGCNRCDDECAKKDGKQGKDDYKKQRQRTRTNTIQGGRTKTSGPQEHGQGKVVTMCSYNCKGWPNEKCRVSFHFEKSRKTETKALILIPNTSLLRPQAEVAVGQVALPLSSGASGLAIIQSERSIFHE